MAFSATDLHELVRFEIDQARQTGCDVRSVVAAYEETDAHDQEALSELYDEVASCEPTSGWPYKEPSDLVEIVGLLPPPSPRCSPDRSRLEQQIMGGWLGRVSGCNLGKPFENGYNWNASKIREYLEFAGAYPLNDYVPALEPMPPGFKLHRSWTETTLGRLNGSARDDDLDYSMLGLRLVEMYGRGLTSENVARAWLSNFPFAKIFTAERVAYRNMIDNVPLREVATFRNPYREWVGAQIRADIFGWTHPGQPRDAALAAHVDASVSHVSNGLYGSMWAAALIAASFTCQTPQEALLESFDHIPPQSRIFEALRSIYDRWRSGETWNSAIDHLTSIFSGHAWVHVLPNACVVASSLLWGHGDFTETVRLAVQAGWDTDSNAATAGSAIGVLLGAAAIPDRFTEPLHDRVRSAIFEQQDASISDLAQRTTALALSSCS